MEFALPFLIAIGVIGATWTLTRTTLNYVKKQGMVDVPNERSAHSTPTPRGGGLAIAIVMFVATTFAFSSSRIGFDLWAALLGGGLLVAVIGWLDDRSHISAALRGICHLLASVWAVYWLAGMPVWNIGGHSVYLGPMGSLLAVLSIAWVINLYNFMDGTDGLAAAQGAMTGALGSILLAQPAAGGLALVSAASSLACIGFFQWNRPPAKIFMGDVASGLLGFWFAVVAFAGERLQQVPSLLWLIALAPFVADASFTLCWRIVRGERWYVAHRTHAYQQLLTLGFNHQRILYSFLALNFFICWPMAALAAYWPHQLPCLVAGLYAALWVLWSWVQRRAKKIAVVS